jgi:hypothetical protein
MKHKSAIVGETIAFSKYNKSFKPLGLPSGRVKSREDLTEMISTNILKHYVVNKKEFSHKHMVHTSRVSLTS